MFRDFRPTHFRVLEVDVVAGVLYERECCGVSQVWPELVGFSPAEAAKRGGGRMSDG